MVAADYDFKLNRSQIIRAALRKVGGIHEGEVLSAYKEQACAEALNTMVKSWQTRGVFLWTERVVSQVLVAGTDDYALPVDSNGNSLLSIDKAYIRDSNGDIDLEVKTWREYQEIYKKADQGFPKYIFHDISSGKFYLHCVPDDAYTLYILGIGRLKDFDNADSTGDNPSRWDRALVFGLAKELMFEYPTSADQRQMILDEAEIAFKDGKSTEIQSNSDIQAVASCFPRRG